MSYPLVSINKLTDQQARKADTNQCFRCDKVANADSEKKHLNKILIGPSSGTYWSAIQKKIAESSTCEKKKIRSNVVVALEVTLTHAPNANVDVSFQETWEKERLEWLNNVFGAENIVAVTCCYEQHCPRIEALVVPLLHGELNSRHFFKECLSAMKLQNELIDVKDGVGL